MNFNYDLTLHPYKFDQNSFKTFWAIAFTDRILRMHANTSVELLNILQPDYRTDLELLLPACSKCSIITNSGWRLIQNLVFPCFPTCSTTLPAVVSLLYLWVVFFSLFFSKSLIVTNNRSVKANMSYQGSQSGLRVNILQRQGLNSLV